MPLHSVGEPTSMALDLKTSVIMSFLSVLEMLNTFTTVAGLSLWISAAMRCASFSVPCHIVS